MRSILIHGQYQPRRLSGDRPAGGAEHIADGTLTADELVQWYCTKVYADTRNYEETARRLHLDPRTVRTKVADWAARATPQ